MFAIIGNSRGTGSGDGLTNGYGDGHGGGSGDGSLVQSHHNTGFGPCGFLSGNGLGISYWHGAGFNMNMNGGWGIGFMWNDRYNGGRGQGHGVPEHR